MDTTGRNETPAATATKQKPVATVEYFDVAHGGSGWYWHSSLTEDAVGPFSSSADAATAAESNGCVVVDVTKAAA